MAEQELLITQKPKSPLQVFKEQNIEQVKNENPDESSQGVQRIILEMWDQRDPEQKKKDEEEYQKDLESFYLKQQEATTESIQAVSAKSSKKPQHSKSKQKLTSCKKSASKHSQRKQCNTINFISNNYLYTKAQHIIEEVCQQEVCNEQQVKEQDRCDANITGEETKDNASKSHQLAKSKNKSRSKSPIQEQPEDEAKKSKSLQKNELQQSQKQSRSKSNEQDVHEQEAKIVSQDKSPLRENSMKKSSSKDSQRKSQRNKENEEQLESNE